MTAEERSDRVERLEKRVDKIEDLVAANLQRIFEALEELKIDGVRNACPSPGACLQLSHDLTSAIKYLDATTQRVERLELKILDLEREKMRETQRVQEEFHKLNVQKAWILGVWSAVAFFASVIGAGITIWINHLLK
jgi:hypothetical protein